MGINSVIAIYYAAIIAWSVRYMIFSFNQEWGDDAKNLLHEGLPESGEAAAFL